MIQRQLKQLPLTVISPKPELVPRSIFQLGIQSRLITNISNIPELLVDDKGHYMIKAECLDDLDMVLSEFEKTGKWHSTSKFFIFLQNDEDLDSIAEIFKKLWKLYIYNAVATTDFINFYTWFPYAINNNCGREFHLSECPRNNSFDPFANKIPKKVNNCEFNVTMAIAEMYTDEKTNEGFINAYIDTICEKLNMSSKFLPRNYVKYIEESGNLNLIPEEMENDNIQAAQVVLLFDKRLPCNFCQYTWSILDTNLYFAVPFRKKLPTKILEILPNNVKISYIFIAILFVITWKFINKVTWQRSIFDITQLLVTVQTTRRCMRRSANCLLILIFWYGLIMNTVYSTGLGSILTRPELSPKIQTLEQLLVSDYRIASNIMSMQFIEESDPDKALKIKKKVIEGSKEIPYPETIRRFMKNPDHSIGIITNTFWQIRNLKDIEIILDDPVSN
ncbi:unnamed protein product [Phaedon cochleariae]|uniref:Ionotropic receptor n=1 Tax=Phaedon cochleariae TaxID=80249 RepID=A0A9N9SFX0_PHACE|nr:unnamed protein product [Phaedon cochleariae]